MSVSTRKAQPDSMQQTVCSMLLAKKLEGGVGLQEVRIRGRRCWKGDEMKGIEEGEGE